MNYMKQVAELLGVELGEEFEFKDSDGNVFVGDSYRLDTVGVQRFNPLYQRWEVEDATDLTSLLTGALEIVEKPWKPAQGDIYYFMTVEDGAHKTLWDGTSSDVMRYRLGNCYKTQADADADVETWRNFYSNSRRIEWEGNA